MYNLTFVAGAIFALALFAPVSVVFAQQVPLAPKPLSPKLTGKVFLEAKLYKTSDSFLLLSKNTGVPLSLAGSAPDKSLYIACKNESLGDVLKQMRLLMTDRSWKYNWAEYRFKDNTFGYRFWRAAVDSATRSKEQQADFHARMKRLLDTLRDGETGLEKLAQDEPEMANDLQNPLISSRLQLLDSLSPDQLNQALSGAPLRFNMGQLTAQQRDLALRLNGQDASLTVLDKNGRTISQQGQSDFVEKGELLVRRMTPTQDPSAISLRVEFVIDAGSVIGYMGGDALYPDNDPFWQPVKEAVAERKKTEAREALSKVSRAKKTVTIEANTPLQTDETPLAAYLRSLSDQTQLTVLGHWRVESLLLQKRMPRSIRRQPIADALDIVCAHYKLDWQREGNILRVRAKDSASDSVENLRQNGKSNPVHAEE